MIADKTFVPRDVIGYWLSPFLLMVFIYKNISSYVYLKCQRHYLFNMEFCLAQIFMFLYSDVTMYRNDSGNEKIGATTFVYWKLQANINHRTHKRKFWVECIDIILLQICSSNQNLNERYLKEFKTVKFI